jgi:hypothetical protein
MYLEAPSSLDTLTEFVTGPDSELAIEAVEAIGNSKQKDDARRILKKFLSHENFDIRFKAYTHLLRLGDPVVYRRLVGGDFFLDMVMGESNEKVIYVSRQDYPRIVLFGAPVYCEDNIFIVTKDQQVMVNGVPGEDKISVLRKHPTFPRPIGPFYSSRNLAEVIRAISERIDVGDRPERRGLGVSYSDLVNVLQLMTDHEAVKARMVMGPMNEVIEQFAGR